MADISNKTLALLVLAALLTVVIATGVQLDRLNNPTLTGFATTDQGQVTLTIADALNIEVASGLDTIAFGTCTPQLGDFVANTNDTDGTNCTGDTATPQYIRINNIGNVDALINVSGECTIADFLPQSGGAENSTDFRVLSGGAGCDSGNVGLTPLGQSNVTLCSNLTSGATNFMFMYAAVNITPDTTSPACDDTGSPGTNTLTYWGAIA